MPGRRRPPRNPQPKPEAEVEKAFGGTTLGRSCAPGPKTPTLQPRRGLDLTSDLLPAMSPALGCLTPPSGVFSFSTRSLQSQDIVIKDFLTVSHTRLRGQGPPPIYFCVPHPSRPQRGPSRQQVLRVESAQLLSGCGKHPMSFCTMPGLPASISFISSPLLRDPLLTGPPCSVPPCSSQVTDSPCSVPCNLHLKGKNWQSWRRAWRHGWAGRSAELGVGGGGAGRVGGGGLELGSYEHRTVSRRHPALVGSLF